jgi:hypothetical protein
MVVSLREDLSKAMISPLFLVVWKYRAVEVDPAYLLQVSNGTMIIQY